MGSSQMGMVLILLLASVSSVLGHGGMVWPPIWQDGEGLGLEEVYMSWIGTKPDGSLVDPKTGREIDNTKSWSTDQAYTYGHGENKTLAKTGPHTNYYKCNEPEKYSSWNCAHWKHPRAAPGETMEPGEGFRPSSRTMLWCPRTSSPGSTCSAGGGTP